MTKQGYKFKHTETCNIRTQQIIYSCTEGHVMRFFFYKKTWCICKFLHSMFERAIAFKCLEFFFFFSYSEWNAFLTDSQCTLNQKTFVMVRSFFSRDYYLEMLDKLFISNLFSSYNKMFFFTFIKIVLSIFFTSKQKINLSKFSDMGYVLFPHLQTSSL